MILALVASGGAAAQASLEPEAIEAVSANVFEVVALKPSEESIRYAERLPFELLPFLERNDEYIPLGTAFAIQDKRFVSAAHVFTLERATLWDRLYLRRPGGKAYPIDTIWSYSGDRDFVVFSVEGWDGAAGGLALSTRPVLNQRVYAVGNALGQGVVIRDGILTSMTPESEDGAWEWLRFSAAASLGNSGGPLVDAAGRVIGVVTAKSEAENLNYALPCSEALSFATGTGELIKRYKYRLPNVEADHIERFTFRTGLPKPLPELRSEMVAFLDGVVRKGIDSLLSENGDKVFPRGDGSRRLLDTITYSAFPMFAAEKADGTWQMLKPEKTSAYRVGGDGTLELGELWGDTFALLSKPRDTTVASLFENPRALLDLILEGYAMTRSVGTKKVRITSYGTPSVVQRFADSWGRKWLLASWDIPFANKTEVMLATPTPSGAAVVLRLCPYGDRNSFLADFRAMTEFFAVSYRANLRNWGEYLARDALTPAFLSDFSVRLAAGERVSLKSRRMAFEYDSDMLAAKEDTVLSVIPAFCREEKVVWDTAQIFIEDPSRPGSYISILKMFRPTAASPDPARQAWEAAVRGKFPFNLTKISHEGASRIFGVLNPGRGGSADPRFVYSVAIATDGEATEGDLRARMYRARGALVLSAYELEASALPLDPSEAKERR